MTEEKKSATSKIGIAAITQSEQERKNRLKKKNDQCQEPVGLYKRSIVHVIQLLKRKEKEGGPKNVLKEIRAENFTNMAKDINLRIQEAECTPG